MVGILRRHEAPREARPHAVRARRAAPRSELRQRAGPPARDERTSPRCCASAGYDVAYKGKWHLTHPSGRRRRCSAAGTPRDAELNRRDYGFADWEAARRGREREGGALRRRQRRRRARAGTRSTRRQAERWLGRADLPEPFCLVVSLVNPHDVLGYPASVPRAAATPPTSSASSACELPPTVDEDLATKPAVHSLMRMGMTAYLGPLRDRRAQLDYVNFYAHLHRVVDAKLGRLARRARQRRRPGLAALANGRGPLRRPRRDGPLPRRPAPEDASTSTRRRSTSRSSSPTRSCSPSGAETDALASLVDVLPTMLSLGGRRAPEATCAGAT